MALPTSYNLFRHTEIAKNYRNFVSTFSEWKSYMLLTGNESEDEKILSTFINTIAHEEGHAVVMVVGCAMRELNGYDGLFLIRCLQFITRYLSQQGIRDRLCRDEFMKKGILRAVEGLLYGYEMFKSSSGLAQLLEKNLVKN